jgi:hypothetical protein
MAALLLRIHAADAAIDTVIINITTCLNNSDDIYTLGKPVCPIVHEFIFLSDD